MLLFLLGKSESCVLDWKTHSSTFKKMSLSLVPKWICEIAGLAAFLKMY